MIDYTITEMNNSYRITLTIDEKEQFDTVKGAILDIVEKSHKPKKICDTSAWESECSSAWYNWK